MPSRPRSAKRSSNTPPATAPSVGVIVDAGFVHECVERQRVPRANYGALRTHLGLRISEMFGNEMPNIEFYLCTSAPLNDDDVRFRRFVSQLNELEFQVYAANGAAAYLRDLRGYVDEPVARTLKLPLQRQDALIGYLVGRLLETHEHLAVMSDSAALVHVLKVAALKRKTEQIFIAPESMLPGGTVEMLKRNVKWVRFGDLDDRLQKIFTVLPVPSDLKLLPEL